MKPFFRFIVGTVLALQPVMASAQTVVDSRGFSIDPGFDPNSILTDNDVFDTSRMTKSHLQSFLSAKGVLNTQPVLDIDGVEKAPSEIIWRVALSYKINPQFLLALLQKEQSLVEAQNPTQRQLDWATGFGVCDDCSKDDPRIQDYKGFANQLEYAAKQMRERYYMRLLSLGHTGTGSYALGKTIDIDGIQVTPANIATASLYTYTPHIHGNLNLWRIWQRWFSRTHPNGTVVRGVPSNTLWWINNGAKRPFASATVAGTLVDVSKVVEASDTELAGYADGDPIQFPNYSLLRDPSGKVWLLVGNDRRHIKNMEAFRKFSFNMDEVEDVSEEDLAPYDIIAGITTSTQYAQGSLLQDAATHTVWYTENDLRQRIEHPALLALYFKGRKPKSVSSAVLDKLTDDGVYKIHDSELVKSTSSTAVYVVEYGLLRPIVSGDVFEQLGWKWKNVVTLPESLLASYALGAPMSTEISEVQVAQR
jgi:hypothetical protein